MRGKILGASADGGTISGEDGKRYRFDPGQWKSERSPAQGDEVDFEVGDQGTAHEVFSVKTGVTIDLGAVGEQAKALLGDGANSPLGARAIALVKSNLLFQLSFAILIVSCLFTYVKLTGAVGPAAYAALPDHGAYKIINVGDLVDYLKTSFDAAAGGMDQAAQMMSGIGQDGSTSPFGDPRAIADNLRAASAMSNLLYLAYLVPIGASAIIVQLLRRKGLSLIPLATGAACVTSFALLVLCQFAVASAVKKMTNADAAAAAAASKSIAFGLGSYIILLCGLALLGVALGIVRLPQRT